MKKFLVLLILLCSPVLGVQINEVLFNPYGSDNNKEFVEIYLDGFENLENWTISDIQDNDTLKAVKIVNSSYALITEKDFNHSNLNCSIYSAGATIGNGLNNDRDTIKLYQNNTLKDSMNYSSQVEGTSIIKKENIWNSAKKITPCLPNNYSPKNITENLTTNHSINKTNYNVSNETKINKTKDIEKKDKKVCKAKINTSTDKKIYKLGEKISFKHNVKTNGYPFKIKYWIESLNGKIEKSEYTTKNTNQKSWTARTEHEAILIKSIINVECNDTKTITNKSKKLIGINQTKQNKEKIKTNIEIVDVNSGSDGRVKFGEVFTVELKINKGETRKYSIECYARGEHNIISEKTRLYIHKENSKTKITVPIALKENCNQRYNEGSYKLVIDGLGKRKEETIFVENNTDCQVKEIYEKKIIEKKLPGIKSFYSMMKNYHKKINFYATFDNINTTHKVMLHTKNKTKEYKINNNKKIKMSAPAEKGYNLYVLELTKDNEKKDASLLKMNFTKSIKKNSEKKYISEKANTITQNKKTTPENKITGETIFKSIEAKSLSSSKYLVASLFLLTVGYVIYSKQSIRKLFKRVWVFGDYGTRNNCKSNNRDGRLP
ncbi:MAG: lamin tail domain-containing protein [Nanobdellota archaeon]